MTIKKDKRLEKLQRICVDIIVISKNPVYIIG